MTYAEIEQMTLSERLDTMEKLWQAIAGDAHGVPSPDWHREVLDGRMEQIRRGEATFHSVNEVRRRLLGE